MLTYADMQTHLEKKLWVRVRNVLCQVFDLNPDTVLWVPILLAWSYALIDEGAAHSVQQEILKNTQKDKVPQSEELKSL